MGICGGVVFFQISSDELASLYGSFVAKYPIVTIEDPFDQDDWAAYAKLMQGAKYQIVG